MLAALAAVGFLVVHLGALPRSLEDIDSINFGLGVERFDVAAHRPHPPGYPVYVALAKVSTSATAVLAPGLSRDERAAIGLAIWSVLAGALAAIVLVEFWIAVGLPPGQALLAMLLVVCAPLFWITAARPLTDTPGLVAALIVQTATVTGWRAFGHDRTRLPRAWLLAAAGAGLIVGLRSQTMWLTGPLLIWVFVTLVRSGRSRGAAALAGAAVAGALVWVLPLVWLSGGLSAYGRALGSQGAEDFEGVWMLAAHPSMNLATRALEATFLIPWQGPVLGGLVLMLGIVGGVRLLRTDRWPIIPLLLGFVPYLIFHVAFHETAEIRYALPVLVPMAGFAILGLATLGRRAVAIGGAAIAAAGGLFGHVALAEYAAEPSPVFRAFQDMQRTLPAHPNERPVLQMHHQVWWGVRRAADWYRPYWDLGPQPFPGDHEWLTLVDWWRQGHPGAAFLLADLKRNDVQVFDARSRTLIGRYAREPVAERLLGGSRLESLALWRLERPGWMLGRGWSITPEVAGLTQKDGREPHKHAAEAYLLRRPGPHRLMIGGRYLSGEAPGTVVVMLDGREIDRSTVAAEPNWFLRWVDLPHGALDGESPYAVVTVRVLPARKDMPAPNVGLEQFDAAPAGEPMFGFERGWQELEENPSIGLLWRWSTARAELSGFNAGHDVKVTIGGETPLKYFARAPVVTIAAGNREIGRFSPDSDFEHSVVVPADVLGPGLATITISTDLTFVPAERGSSPDRRQLGLRLYRVEVGRR
jgi:hypothetical protein